MQSSMDSGLFNLIDVFNWNQITIRVSAEDFRDSIRPAYCDTWEKVNDYMSESLADKAIVSKLSREYLKYGYFNNWPVVGFPVCDLDDHYEYSARVENGMHRLTAMSRLIDQAVYSPFAPPWEDSDLTTVVLLTFDRDLGQDEFDNVFSWMRSMCLPSRKWVETSTSHPLDSRTLELLMDHHVEDHTELKDCISLLAYAEDFAPGLVEILIEDEDLREWQ